MADASVKRSARRGSVTGTGRIRDWRLRRILIGGTVLAVVAAVGVSPAAWSSWQALTRAESSLAAGTISAELADVPTATTVNAATHSVLGSFTVKNPGSMDANYAVSFTTLAGASVFRQFISVWKSTGTCTATPGPTVQSGRWDTFSYTGTMTAGEIQAMCMKVEFGGEATKSANYSFTGTLTLTNSRGSVWSAQSAKTSTFSLTGAIPAALDISAVNSRVTEVTAAGVGAAHTADIANYTLYRSGAPNSLGTAVATGASPRLIDKLAEATPSNGAPPPDSQYWYTVVGYDSSGDIMYTAGPQRVLWPLASDQDVLVRVGTDRTLCWQVAGTASGSSIQLQSCDASNINQHFRLDRYLDATNGDRFRIRSVAATPLVAVRGVVADANDTLLLGSSTGDTFERFFHGDPGVPSEPSNPVTALRNSGHDSSSAASHCVGASSRTLGGTVNVTSTNCWQDSSVSWIVDPITSTTAVSKDDVVISASSAETAKETGLAARVYDGDATTLWHTQYYPTLAQYPHWIRFDVKRPRTVTGIGYQARPVQNTSGLRNGNVKNYRVEVSMDGTAWATVAEGAFTNGTSAMQNVVFSAPVTARYVRMYAVSPQTSTDPWASAAEMRVYQSG